MSLVERDDMRREKIGLAICIAMLIFTLSMFGSLIVRASEAADERAFVENPAEWDYVIEEYVVESDDTLQGIITKVTGYSSEEAVEIVSDMIWGLNPFYSGLIFEGQTIRIPRERRFWDGR